MTTILSIQALSVLFLGIILWFAPDGWQDDMGFHYGHNPKDDA